jgi:phospholipase/carboxylesterase/glyoxalase family protein
VTAKVQLDFVHRFVPASPGGPAATLLLLHGTGGDEDDMIPLGRELLPGAALLSPRGRVLEHGMPRFFRRLSMGVFDLEDLKVQTDALEHFVGAASRNYGFEKNQIIAVGYSNGANIAASELLMHPKLLSRAILFRPMIPFRPGQDLDTTTPELKDKPVLVAAARHDQIVPTEQTVELSAILTAAGARVTTHWHPGGHELGSDDVAAAKEWLSRETSAPTI